MKRTDGFLLKYIEGVPYLLPYGQRIAEHRRNLRLNDTSALIWEMLPECDSSHDLHEKMTGHWNAKTQEDCDRLWQDLQEILAQFQAFGLIDLSEKETGFPVSVNHYRIADIGIRIQGAPDSLLTFFAPYGITGSTSSDLEIRIHPSAPLSTAPLGGELLLRDPELHIVQQPEGKVIHFPSLTHIFEVHTNREDTSADIFCLPPWTDALTEELIPVIRLLFNRYAQTKGMLFLHSASLLYHGKAWLFSGSSGTGKSTHTNLWHTLWNTPVLNGDLNLLAIKDGEPVIYGTPWCGTSGISDSTCHPLGGVVLLRQAATERLEELSPDEQILGILQRVISPSDSELSLCKNLEIIKQITKHIPVVRLHSTKEPHAAIYMKEQIDALQ